MFAKGLVEDGKCFIKDFHDLGVVSIVKVKAAERTARREPTSAACWRFSSTTGLRYLICISSPNRNHRRLVDSRTMIPAFFALLVAILMPRCCK
jgi:hypothetical protein